MMKKELLLLSLGIFSKIAVAQQITSSDLQVAGKAYLLGVNTTNASSVSIGGKGTGLNWDFSSFGKESNDTVATLVPSTTPYGSFFSNTSNALITTDSDGKTFSYYTVSPSKVEVTGVAYESSQLLETPKVVLTTITPLNFYETLPLQIGHKTYSKGTYKGKAKYTAYPTVDSLEMTMVVEKWDTIDASGSVKIPGGNTYDVLRLKTHAKRTITFRIKSSITGWTNPPSPYNAPNIDEGITYNFWTKNVGNEVFSIKYDSPTATTPASVKWYLNTVTGIENESSSLTGVYVSPNPSNGQFQLNGVNGNYDITISNMQGKNVFAKKALFGVQSFDLSNFEQGMYIASIETANGQKTKTKFLVQK